ncbi:MAG: hypothetical protein OXQ92_09085 [Boseongicola sp.]|nr:hypothetical protein [Boseongicola sp.]
MNKSLAVFCAVVAFAAPASSWANEQSDAVLGCFQEIGTSTEWNTCMAILFQPCAEFELASEEVRSCLQQERDNWRATKIDIEAEVFESLTNKGIQELADVMLAWPKFVDDKCKAMAEGRTGESTGVAFDATRLGCQVSEYALITSELTACNEGRSKEEYCQRKGE